MAALLSEEGSLWRRGVHRVVGAWLLRRLGLGQDWLAPARLDFVYDDDLGNLPIHYIALGTPVSMCAGLCSPTVSCVCLRVVSGTV